MTVLTKGIDLLGEGRRPTLEISEFIKTIRGPENYTRPSLFKLSAFDAPDAIHTYTEVHHGLANDYRSFIWFIDRLLLRP